MKHELLVGKVPTSSTMCAKTHDFWKPTRNLTDFVSPVPATGRLYIRTPEELICYRVKK